MRIVLSTSLALLITGCVQQVPVSKVPVARASVSCEANAVLNEGLETRAYPRNCDDDPALIKRYNLGLRIATLEEELRDVNYRIASRDSRGPLGRIGFGYHAYHGFRSKGYLVGRRSDIRDELRFLRREAGLLR